MKPKNPHAVALGALGGRRSAATRMQAITPAKRQEMARNAARASWGPAARAKRAKNGRKPYVRRSKDIA